MSRNFMNPNHRDYGATSSSINSSNVITAMPDINYSGFSPTEFMSLSENVAHNINSVKSSWQQLEKALKLIGTNRDTLATRDKIHHIQTQTNYKIQVTSKDLHRLTSVIRRGDKQQKLQIEKLATDFKIIVEKYSQSQQQIAMKMKQIYLQSINGQQQDNDQQQLLTNGYNDNDDDGELLMQQQKQLQSNLQFEQDLLKDRENRIKEIEADVLDVNKIMRELSSLVNQQGEQIDTIESSIDHTCADVEAGRAELLKAAEYRSRYRRKIFILLIIAVIVGLIITGIIVSSIKS